MNKLRLVVLLGAMTLLTASWASACFNGEGCAPVTQGTDSGWAYTANGQVQGQVGDGKFVTSTGPTGFVGGTAGGVAQGQVQGGLGAASPGQKAASELNQAQGKNQLTEFGDGSGPFYTGVQSTGEQIQHGEGKTTGADYKFGNAQGQVGGAVAVIDLKGQFGAAGSGYVGGGLSHAEAGGEFDGSGSAKAEQSQTFNGSYASLNQGPNGYTQQAGTQEVEMGTKVAAANGGVGDASVIGAQAGGSVVYNDGKAGVMGGVIGAASVAKVDVSSNECATAEGFANLTQTHTYNQGVVDPATGSYQTSDGMATTTVRVKERN
ncbi:hypothetical protein DRQ25_10600 [Candidatus Fermentibacteria bacterium]|nr:MAG: hypothetical protein DRQ25_10600 [Candidatus Fermentibacteria bacterium]